VSRTPPQPGRSTFTGDELKAYDEVLDRRRRLMPDLAAAEDLDAGPYYGALLNSPRAAAAMNALGSFVRTRGEGSGSFTHAERELVDQVLSWDWDTGVVQRMHIPDGLAVGVRLEAIEALRDGREEDLTDDERQLVDFIREVTTGRVTDESYAGIEARFGRRGAVEYTFLAAFLQMVIRLHQAFAVPEPSRAELDAIIADYREGRRELPDASVRIG
jgi:hypothetical protein